MIATPAIRPLEIDNAACTATDQRPARCQSPLAGMKTLCSCYKGATNGFVPPICAGNRTTGRASDANH